MKYLLFCDNCGQKHFTNGDDLESLTELKKAAPPKKRNEKGEIEYQQMPKSFKCYNCGYLFRITELKKEEQPKEKRTEDERDKFLSISDEDYLKTWEREVIKSARKKNGNIN